MSSEQLEQLRKEAEKNPKKSWRYLQFLEDNNLDKPKEVTHYGKILLDSKNVPANKRWRLLERVVISALQCHKTSVATECLNELSQSFGEDSKRIKLLRGMILEKQEEWNKTEHIYNLILKEDNNNTGALKRKIALLISQRNEKAAIHKLNEYLSLVDAFDLKQHNYELAKFACEELLMLPTQSLNFFFFKKKKSWF
ncbi:tetratricopeptide repeat protein 35 [Reticulomyxa filosa]|uniref:ER membrane protein complex subunit 2 n=1 Tax=Reticulomyxa filosa TaxID=46433 RepID=X6NV29_RETFI|nr:tetratricopeptide repeat protein 35 [Reticulomyxa filosa]|eukprot:ETO29748.1 tetratricopeptide repeat protein 35 [Reticulomyxa filosa]